MVVLTVADDGEGIDRRGRGRGLRPLLPRRRTPGGARSGEPVWACTSSARSSRPTAARCRSTALAGAGTTVRVALPR